MSEPIKANTIWDKARKAITIGEVIKKPIAVPIETNIAVTGDINIARNVGTWLAKVKDIGSSIILSGENNGIIMPIAHKSAAITILVTADDTFVRLK